MKCECGNVIDPGNTDPTETRCNWCIAYDDDLERAATHIWSNGRGVFGSPVRRCDACGAVWHLTVQSAEDIDECPRVLP